NKYGLVSPEELADLEAHEKNIDIERILEIELETKHDVFAAIKEFGEHAKIGGGKIHLGATSVDILDNTEALRYKEGLSLLRNKLHMLLGLFAEKIEQYAHTPCIGYTHLQPAEPTTIGYRFAFYAQDLLDNVSLLEYVYANTKGKGMKGAVGTAASYELLLKDLPENAQDLESEVMNLLDLKAVLISTQIAPRQQDYLIMSLLSEIASTFAKFAGDLRILQSPNYGEWSEPFGKKQVGSSAMPFKRNPISSEKVCSLARMVSQMPAALLENASLSYLERTLDDSANKRVIVPEGFLAVDEILNTSTKLLKGMHIHEEKIAFNLRQYAPFAATEGVMMECSRKGASRQEMHELLRELSMEAWQEVQNGRKNTLPGLLLTNETILKHISKDDIVRLLEVHNHIGNAPERALQLVTKIKTIIS
ncbi:adenylosuccinate lyase, partial [Candidatus Roizmanbacteria bacterium]|nr:adenylosuccinate lyase [Candidatus Roizmanbacteria bacterium]